MTRAARWERVAVVERGRRYVDHVSGPFRVAQGYDEQARREGRPWSLLEAGRDRGTFGTVAEAKGAARSAPAAIPSRRRRAA